MCQWSMNVLQANTIRCKKFLIIVSDRNIGNMNICQAKNDKHECNKMIEKCLISPDKLLCCIVSTWTNNWEFLRSAKCLLNKEFAKCLLNIFWNTNLLRFLLHLIYVLMSKIRERVIKEPHFNHFIM